ncbi:hypothetical protein [Aureimonas endophytica]|nr:hypothetical protein [Aureimonas endophytica]
MVDGVRVEMTDDEEAAFIGDAPSDPDSSSGVTALIPVFMLRQRIEKLGMWDDFAAYLAQNPAEMLKVLTLENGVDPAYPAIAAAFQAMSVPQAARDYILASPSVGVPDVQLAA